MALEDLGYDNVQIIFSDPKNSPQLLDEKGKPKSGTAFVDGKGVRTIIINAEDPKNSTRSGLIGTLTEEGSHIIGKIEGRQIETGTDERGLESTGRTTNEYFQDKYKGDDIAISIQSDGKDYSNVDFGENVGDGKKVATGKGAVAGGYLGAIVGGLFCGPVCAGGGAALGGLVGGALTNTVYKMEIKDLRKLISQNADRKAIEKKLIDISVTAGSGYKSKYEGIYVLGEEDLRNHFLSKDDSGTRYLDIQKFDPEGLKRVEDTALYKKAVNEIISQAKIKYIKATDITVIDKKGRLISQNPKTNNTDHIISSNTFKLAGSEEKEKSNTLEYALGKTSLAGSVIPKKEVRKDGTIKLTVYVRYQISDDFKDPTGMKSEWGKPYPMRGRIHEFPIREFSRIFKNEAEYLKFAKNKRNKK